MSKGYFNNNFKVILTMLITAIHFTHPSCSFMKLLDAGSCGMWGRHAWLSELDSQIISRNYVVKTIRGGQTTRALTVKTSDNQWYCKPTWLDWERNERHIPESTSMLSLHRGKRVFKRTCLDSRCMFYAAQLQRHAKYYRQSFSVKPVFSSTAVMTIEILYT